MPKQYVDDLNSIYNEDIVLARPGKGAEDLPTHCKEGTTGKVFDDGGPANADGFHAAELDPKKKKDKKKDSEYEEDKFSSAVSEESANNSQNFQEKGQEEINNCTMSNKSTFDKLFEDVMGEGDFDLGAEDMHDGMELDMDHEEGEEGEGGSLKEKLADAIASLQEVHDALEDDVEDDAAGDIEDIEDGADPYAEAVDAEEKGHALVNGDAAHHNKDSKVAGAADPTGGSADAKAAKGGDGKVEAAKDGVPHNTKAKTAGNHKVGAKL